MIAKTTAWLLAGAALALCAGASAAAVANEETARRQAAQDSAAAPERSATPESRIERREVRVAHDGDGKRREVYIHRGHGDHDVTVIRGGGREETLSAVLQLRPDQQPALKTFLEATRRTHGPHEGMAHIGRESEGRTTMERLDEMKAKMDAQQAEANRRIAAIRTFYGQLDETQKKAFDAMPMLMMVGPSIGPMMIPRPLPIAHRAPPAPPLPPAPPAPPRS